MKPPGRYFRRDKAFILLPVVLILVILGAIAFLLSRQGAMNAGAVVREYQSDVARYVAEAGLNHALWQANQQNCTAYADLNNITLGPHRYSARYAPASGSPVMIDVTGTHAQGAKYSLRRYAQKIYQFPDSQLLVQPDAVVGRETYLSESQPGWNYGQDSRVRVDAGFAGSAARGLFQFNLGGLPAGVHILSATLELYQNSNSAVSGTVSVHRVTSPWAEGQNIASMGESSWSERDGSNSWQQPGGDYEVSAVATTRIVDTAQAWYRWEMSSLVQDWVDGKNPNYGFVLMPGAGVSADFYSSDYADSAFHPRLSISYTCECGKVCSSTWFMQQLILSTRDNATLKGLSFTSGALVEYEPATDTASLFPDPAPFDAGVNLDAVHLLQDNRIVFSTSQSATLGGIGFAKEDLVLYDPQTGSISILLDGSALFSAGSNLDIDAVAVRDNGNIILSTSDDATLGGLAFTRGDLIEYNPATDAATLLFDGASLFTGSNEDIDALYLFDDDQIALSTRNNAELGGLGFSHADLVKYDPAANTAQLYFAATNFDADSNLDAVHIDAGSGAINAAACDADYIPDNKLLEFSWDGAATDIRDVDYLPVGKWINGVTIPAGGGLVTVDRTNKRFYVTDMSGSALVDFPAPNNSPSGVSLVRSGPWANHLAVSDSTDKRVYYIDMNGAIQGSFSVAGITQKPLGLAFIDGSASASYDGYLVIASNKNAGGMETGNLYIVDENGVLQASLNINSLTDEPTAVTHLPGSDKLLVVDENKVFIIGFDGTLYQQYSASGFGLGSLKGVTIDPLSCHHVIVSRNSKTLGILNLFAGAGGSPLTLNPGADSYIYQQSSSTNYGTALQLRTGEDNSGMGRKYRSLLQFDLSAIPVGSSVSSAILRLYQEGSMGSGTVSMDVHQVTASWAENTITWSNSSGGNFDATNLDAVSVVLGSTGWVEWSLPPALIHEWIDSVSPNYGLLVNYNGQKNKRADFVSREHATAAQHPQLVIEYTPP